MSYELRLGSLTPTQRALLEAEGAVEEELGEAPEVDGWQEPVWSLFWRLRRGTPADHPIGPDRALMLAEKLFGEGAFDPHWLLECIEAMDTVVMRHRAARLAEKTGS